MKEAARREKEGSNKGSGSDAGSDGDEASGSDGEAEEEAIADMLETVKVKPCPCKVCLVAKKTAKRRLKSKRDYSYVYSPLERIHLDLLEVNVSSKAGARWALTIYDVATAAGWVYFLQKKSETAAAVIKWHKHAERQGRTVVQTIVSDRGGEILNSTLAQWSDETGVVMAPVAAYCSASNSYAEQFNRRLAETTRALLADASLPAFLWPEAMATACHIHNRIPSQARGLRGRRVSPLEALTGKPSSVAGLRVWGSAMFPHVPEPLRDDKLSDRAAIGILIGFSPVHPGMYKLWEPRSGRVSWSNSVDADETQGSGRALYDKARARGPSETLLEATPLLLRTAILDDDLARAPPLQPFTPASRRVRRRARGRRSRPRFSGHFAI